MGDIDTLTLKAKKIIDKSDIIIGAERMIESFKNKKEVFKAYKVEEIKEYLKDKNAETVSILLSGDVGFYSGAKKLLEELKEYDIEVIAGISSVVYFASRLKISWQDIYLTSLHGIENNIIQYVKRNKRVFTLLDNGQSVEKLRDKLLYYGLGGVKLYIGERLSYSDERIIVSKANELKNFDFNSLCVAIIENENAEDNSLYGIDDDEFIRGKVPMTKAEIRWVSINKLKLSKSSVVYDVGAGTGSVSIECALKAVDGKVYAIEKKEEAVKLIEENKRKFLADNLEIIEGEASERLISLPKPTHAFIGGSGGNLKEIINTILEKNKNTKIVINAISLNTVAEVMEILKDFESSDIVQLNVSKNKTVGSYELMTGQNPIYIITLGKRKEDLNDKEN